MIIKIRNQSLRRTSLQIQEEVQGVEGEENRDFENKLIEIIIPFYHIKLIFLYCYMLYE